MQTPISVGVSEAARLMGVSPSTVVRWANEGIIEPDYTAGGQRRIPMSEIERIKSRTTPTREERNRLKTQAARETLARRRVAPLRPYTAEDVASFSDERPDLKALLSVYEPSEECEE